MIKKQIINKLKTIYKFYKYYIINNDLKEYFEN